MSLTEIQTRIADAARRHGRDPADVNLIAVSKVQPIDRVEAVLDAGHRVFPVSEPTPAVLFGGRRVWFLRVHGFGLIELLEGS